MPTIKQVKHLPAKKRSSLIMVRIQRLDRQRSQFWHNHVQKEINKDRDRADAGWDWVKKYTLLAGVTRFTSARSHAFVYEAKSNADNRWYPIAMISTRIPISALQDNTLKSVYFWWLSTVPDGLLNTWFKSDKPGLVGKSSIEFVVNLSLFNSFDGIIGLHASPKGGNALITFYTNMWLINLPSNVPVPPQILPPALRKNSGNDGRFFYSDQQISQKILSLFDPYR